jgi:hypothetical protein
MSIVSMIAKAALGPVLDVFKDLGGKWIDKKISDAQFKAEVEKALLLAMSNLWTEQAGVIKAEIASDDILTKRWRPITALAFTFIMAWYSLFVPIAVNWMGAPPLIIGDKLLEWVMSLLALCIGGYIGGRTIEKVTDTIVRRKG